MWYSTVNDIDSQTLWSVPHAPHLARSIFGNTSRTPGVYTTTVVPKRSESPP